jgi:hypothetical protein
MKSTLTELSGIMMIVMITTGTRHKDLKVVGFVEPRVSIGKICNDNNTSSTDTRIYIKLGAVLVLTNLHIYCWAVSSPCKEANSMSHVMD